MLDARRMFGNKGEALAAVYLEGKGMRVIGAQERTPFGEIDLVCLDKNELVFVEVKTRRSKMFGNPEEAVTPFKIRHIVRSAQAYIQSHPKLDQPWRIDVVAIQMQENGSPEIVHIKAVDMPDGIW